MNKTNLWLTVFVAVIGMILFMVSFSPATNSSEVDSANIVNSSIQEEDLKVVDSPIDEQCLTYESDIGDFEWQTCGEGAVEDSRALVYDVQKGSAGTLAIGEVVYITGFDLGADVVEVELADASSTATMPGIGIMRSEATQSTSGEMVEFGLFDLLNTFSYSEGDALYVSEVAGELTDTAPTGAAQVQKFAIVARSHISDGRIAVVGAGRENALPNLADDSVWLGDSDGVPDVSALPDCDANILARLQYDVTTNAFSCEQDANLVLPGDLTVAIGTANFSDVNIDGGTINGITDLAVVDGGTGAGSFTDHGVLVGSGSGNISVTTVGTTGQVLTGVTGSDPVWAAAGGGGGGIVVADQWRLHTAFDGDADPIAANLERVDTDGFGQLGAGMTESSGIFTFPETGIWYIAFGALHDSGGGTASTGTSYRILTTTDNSTYDMASYASVGIYAINVQHSTILAFIFDVTNTTTHKVRFSVFGVEVGNGTLGSSGVNFTYMTFLKLGDT